MTEEFDFYLERAQVVLRLLREKTPEEHWLGQSTAMFIAAYGAIMEAGICHECVLEMISTYIPTDPPETQH